MVYHLFTVLSTDWHPHVKVMPGINEGCFNWKLLQLFQQITLGGGTTNQSFVLYTI